MNGGASNFCGEFYVPSPTGGLVTAVRLLRHFTIATLIVIPAKAGIQTRDSNPVSLDSRLRGSDGKNFAVLLPGLEELHIIPMDNFHIDILSDDGVQFRRFFAADTHNILKTIVC